MNEQVRNNVLFEAAQAVCQKLALFFTETIPKIIDLLASRITDNFETLSAVSSG
jgi:hypothetical protein